MAESKKFTFDVPPELRVLMDRHPEVNWTAVFRQSIRRHAEAADLARRIMEEQDDPRVQAVAARLKAGVGKRYKGTRGSPARTR